MKFGILRTVAILFLASCGALSQEKEWNDQINAGDQAMKQHRYADAEKAYAQALPLAQKLGSRDVRISGTLLFLAEAVDAQSRPDEAEALAHRGLAALEQTLKSVKPKGPEQEFYYVNVFAATFDTAGELFAGHHKYTEAEALYVRTIKLREKYMPAKPLEEMSNDDFLRFAGNLMTGAEPKLADSYEKLASLYFIQQKFAPAAELYRKAQPIRAKEESTNPRQLAQTLVNLAACYSAQEKFDQAGPLFVQGLKVFGEANWGGKAGNGKRDAELWVNAPSGGPGRGGQGDAGGGGGHQEEAEFDGTVTNSCRDRLPSPFLRQASGSRHG
jgi:tetratricopeptide (TPR) repeat protein